MFRVGVKISVLVAYHNPFGIEEKKSQTEGPKPPLHRHTSHDRYLSSRHSSRRSKSPHRSRSRSRNRHRESRHHSYSVCYKIFLLFVQIVVLTRIRDYYCSYMITIFGFFLELQIGVSLLITNPVQEKYVHTTAEFGVYYANNTITGKIESCIPFDACQPLQNNLSGSVGFAIRGGPDSCSFEYKVKNVDLLFPLYLRLRTLGESQR